MRSDEASRRETGATEGRCRSVALGEELGAGRVSDFDRARPCLTWLPCLRDVRAMRIVAGILALGGVFTVVQAIRTDTFGAHYILIVAANIAFVLYAVGGQPMLERLMALVQAQAQDLSSASVRSAKLSSRVVRANLAEASSAAWASTLEHSTPKYFTV